MKLSTYLLVNGLTVSQFAKTLGTSHTTVSRYASGARRPGLDMVQRIYEATNRKVRAEDFFNYSTEGFSGQGSVPTQDHMP